MELNYKQYSDQGPALLVLHGLFGSLGNWGWQCKSLSEHFSVYGLDLRNHGSSPHSDDMNYPLMAADVLGFMDQHQLPQAMLLGHSMGGKVAMQVALSHSERIAKLLVVDIAPTAYDAESGGHDRIFEGMQAVVSHSVTSRKEAETQLKVFVEDEDTRQFLLTNLQRNKDGVYDWRLNLSAIQSSYDLLREKPQASKKRQQADAGFLTYDGPVLFVRGSLSNYIMDDSKPEILELFPAAQIKTVSGAGHWVHAEKPRVFHKMAQDFLSGPQNEQGGQ